MGERRMFARSVMYQDQLCSLPPAAQILYQYLNLEADDDGFVANPRMVVCMARAEQSHLQQLVDSGYLIRFDSGVVVIAHWLVHNQIRKDRYKPTGFVNEKNMLELDENHVYRLAVTNGSQMVASLATQDKLSKDKLSQDKISEDKISDGKPDESGSSSSSYHNYENMVLSLYQSCCPNLPRYQYLSDELRANIAILEEKGFDEKTLRKAFCAAAKSTFLTGGGKDGWRADLSWLCKPDNLRKVLDGRYDAFQKAPGNTVFGCTAMGRAELEAIQRLLAEDTPAFPPPQNTAPGSNAPGAVPFT